LYGTDGITDENGIKNLVSKLTGKTGEELDKLFTGIDDNGNQVAKPKWLQEAIAWLNKGINYSIAIDFTAEGGARCSFSVDGKDMYTLAHTGEKVAETIYNRDGTIKETMVLQYETCSKDAPGAIEKWSDTTMTVEQYNNLSDDEKKNYRIKDGKVQSVSYYRKVWQVTTFTDGKADKVYEQTASGERKLIMTYEYDKSGNLVASYDVKNNQKTIYSAGKPIITVTTKDKNKEEQVDKSVATNSDGSLKSGYKKDDSGFYYKIGEKIATAGTVVREWRYLANGALDTVASMDNAGRWSLTVFENGRALMTVNGKYGIGNDLRALYHQILTLSERAANGNSNAQNQLQNIFDKNKYGIIAINLYNDQISNWLKKYGDDKTAQILVKIFGWNESALTLGEGTNTVIVDAGAIAKDTAMRIINNYKTFGANGAQMAVTATYTNSLNQSKSSIFAASVTLFANGAAVVDLNTQYNDPAYLERLQALNETINVSELIKLLQSNNGNLSEVFKVAMDAELAEVDKDTSLSQADKDKKKQQIRQKYQDLQELANALKSDGKIDTAEEFAKFDQFIGMALDSLDKYIQVKLDQIQKEIDTMPDDFKEAFKKDANGNTVYNKIKGSVEKKLGDFLSVLNKVFNFKVESNYLKFLVYDKNSDWVNNALNVSWKRGMTNIINSLKTQLGERIVKMKACYGSFDINALKSLNGNISANTTEKYSHDPSIAGTLQDVVEIDGKYYAVVNADYINIMDGAGVQNAEGELIYVEISAELASQIKDKIGGSVMFMGDVREDVKGHLAITMNVEYGGGYRDLGNMSKSEMRTAMENLANEAWYQKVLNDMKSVWADVRVQYGEYSNWRQGFELLKNYATGGGIVANF
jgi:hypothetical protein